MALKSQLMGVDVQRAMLVKAEIALAKLRFDGKSKNYTYVKYISNMRQAFMDLGPDDQYSEARKVNKLLSSFKVPALQHLGSTIRNDPRMAHNFEAAVNFVAGELQALQQRTSEPVHISEVSRSKKKTKKKEGSKKPDPESEEEAAESDHDPATSEDESVEASEPEHESEEDQADKSGSDDSQDEQEEPTEAATSDEEDPPKSSGRARKKSRAKGKTRKVSVLMSTLPSKRSKRDPQAGHF